jgi:thiamine biosynthesis protein ThiS
MNRRGCEPAVSPSRRRTRIDQNPVVITLNGDRFELPGPVTVGDLLRRLDIDPRRVAVEHNLAVLKRAAFDDTLVTEGDQIEVVNFVGGG